MITHLRFHNIPLNGPWMPNVIATRTLPLFVGGGAVLGMAIGVSFFGDAGLRRLAQHHA